MRVSVIIATYGEPVWEELAETRALPSALDQGAYEVLLDHYPNGTIASARNAIGSRALGDWLCFLDADDELAPNYLGAMRRAFDEQETPGSSPLLLTPAVQQVRKNGLLRGTPSFFDRGIPLTDDNWLVLGTLVERKLFMQVGGFEDLPHGFEDFSLWSKCWRIGAKPVKVPDAIYRYWINPKSKHKMGWRDHRWQVETHHRVIRELDEWEAARA